jgi:hypothetical protein
MPVRLPDSSLCDLPARAAPERLRMQPRHDGDNDLGLQ